MITRIKTAIDATAIPSPIDMTTHSTIAALVGIWMDDFDLDESGDRDISSLIDAMFYRLNSYEQYHTSSRRPVSRQDRLI